MNHHLLILVCFINQFGLSHLLQNNGTSENFSPNEKLYLPERNMTWTEAFKECRNYDSDLVSIYSPHDETNLTQFLEEYNGTAEFWTGLNKINDTYGMLRWLENGTLENYYPSMDMNLAQWPTDHCVSVVKNVSEIWWSLTNCSRSLMSICQIDSLSRSNNSNITNDTLSHTNSSSKSADHTVTIFTNNTSNSTVNETPSNVSSTQKQYKSNETTTPATLSTSVTHPALSTVLPTTEIINVHESGTAKKEKSEKNESSSQPVQTPHSSTATGIGIAFGVFAILVVSIFLYRRRYSFKRWLPLGRRSSISSQSPIITMNTSL